jgi:hypothetical protein
MERRAYLLLRNAERLGSLAFKDLCAPSVISVPLW